MRGFLSTKKRSRRIGFLLYKENPALDAGIIFGLQRVLLRVDASQLSAVRNRCL